MSWRLTPFCKCADPYCGECQGSHANLEVQATRRVHRYTSAETWEAVQLCDSCAAGAIASGEYEHSEFIDDEQ
jgi:hypothetical protein